MSRTVELAITTNTAVKARLQELADKHTDGSISKLVAQAFAVYDELLEGEERGYATALVDKELALVEEYIPLRPEGK